ncbi:integrase catalytic domain-containing protein [Trichonephila clavata]|uniref:Integrase catalytic domain-containing protein n=1 Tax=Trichonephila clavata TaxID=2740835 RepID=A0A8X6LT48_TRICU|nr:integrase catalytic domain-containing protein [Trichonephila clavata]
MCGTASAPYLAIKCLQQLALNESNNFPLASKAALKDFYVDDLMSGVNSLSEALELQNQLTQMVSSAGLVLRKWASNCSELLNSIDSDMRLSNTSLNIDNDDTVKTLGILWHPASDLELPYITSPIYTDSTIVLSWIGSHASRWKTFVANRVAKIQTLSSATQWHHISGSANPADLATRGVSFSTLLTSIWLCGPKFLHETFPFQTDSSVPTLNDAVPEERYCTLQSIIVPNHLPDGNDLLHKFSSLSKLKRVIFCLRFVNNCKNSKDKTNGFLKTNELNNAMHVLIKLVQTIEFNNEINALKRNQPLSCRSKILSLNPFLDNSNILRVGGRLRHANLAYGHKHPILLPKRHILTDLIIRHYHEILLPAGTQLVQSCIQEQYWIIGARNVIRHLIRKCVKCCKVKASITNQRMSDLPSSRISPAPAFMRCGVDYAGPFQIFKTIKGRGSKSFKAYIALFVSLY